MEERRRPIVDISPNCYFLGEIEKGIGNHGLTRVNGFDGIKELQRRTKLQECSNRAIFVTAWPTDGCWGENVQLTHYVYIVFPPVERDWRPGAMAFGFVFFFLLKRVQLWTEKGAD
jgi:hypothetical protein